MLFTWIQYDGYKVWLSQCLNEATNRVTERAPLSRVYKMTVGVHLVGRLNVDRNWSHRGIRKSRCRQQSS